MAILMSPFKKTHKGAKKNQSPVWHFQDMSNGIKEYSKKSGGHFTTVFINKLYRDILKLWSAKSKYIL